MTFPLATQGAEYHHARGLAHRKSSDYAAAVAEYTRAAELEPRHFKALFNRGFSHDKLGQYQVLLSGGVS